MEPAEVIAIIQQELPQLVAQDPLVRDFVLRTVSEFYISRHEADSKFDRILAELQRDREEQTRKWEEQNRKWEEQAGRWEEQAGRWQEQARRWEEQDRRWQEQARRWEEQDHRWQEQARRWEEQDRRWHEQLAEIRRLDKRFESTIGALGSRWGIASEASFRSALAGILTESFGVDVLNLTLYDNEGEVFGRPDQVEIDLIIKNGMTIACEIKSSIDKAGMYIFDRKVNFYARHAQRDISRKIVISPMVDHRALPVAEALGIEIYSYADAVEGLSEE
ncbi:DUF3782 domain-containing protein [Candidatus Synechococcus calcipolaris G9]|uniref:DUF3782 domain-containing protein n=1 Tax=Candidatus Synechococcus calcipolaris G9 TaxID=1497997 RepID=A0ABT6EWR6_9SYNE|nr:DUF3782 domain-containing protein [Candidatus Synechococcus calcipolaris]MDG2989553.1 DUF3782 domain-containing protein [Candidatus Synechococcus calcipolaris G9]